MTKMLRLLLLSCLCTIFCGPASANPVLSLVPESPKIHALDNLFVDVVISGLGSGGSETLLGAFDLTVKYNPNVVEFLATGSSLGTGLGDPSDPLQTLVYGDTSNIGIFRFYEVSLLEVSAGTCIFCAGPYLQDLQSDSLLLAKLMFYLPSAPPGTSFTTFVLPLNDVILSDSDGNAITGVTVQNAAVLIPEPATVLVLGGLLVVLASARRPKRD